MGAGSFKGDIVNFCDSIRKTDDGTVSGSTLAGFFGGSFFLGNAIIAAGYNIGGNLGVGDPGSLGLAFLGGFIGVILAIPVTIVSICTAGVVGTIVGFFKGLFRKCFK